MKFDQNLFAEIFRSRFAHVSNIAKCVGLRGEDISEVAADAFEKFFRRWQDVDLENPEGYLVKIAWTTAIDKKKYLSGHPEGHSKEIEESDSFHPDPELEYMDNLTQGKLRALVDEFERKVGHDFISTFYYQEKDVDEMCKKMKWPRGSFGHYRDQILAQFERFVVSKLKRPPRN